MKMVEIGISIERIDIKTLISIEKKTISLKRIENEVGTEKEEMIDMIGKGEGEGVF